MTHTGQWIEALSRARRKQYRRKLMNQKIRIKLRAYDHSLVDQSAERIIEVVKKDGHKRSPVPYPFPQSAKWSR